MLRTSRIKDVARDEKVNEDEHLFAWTVRNAPPGRAANVDLHAHLQLRAAHAAI